MNESEQRRVSRHRGKLPVYLKNGQGVTRDFNVSGIYFETDRSFSAGQTIEFSIILRHVDPDRPLRLKCLGEIVRVEGSGQKTGIATSINSFSFEELGAEELMQGKEGKEKRGETAKK